MEKRTPHYSLQVVKNLVKANKVRLTGSAVQGAELLGFDRKGVMDVIMALAKTDFYKSMTTYTDHTIWQDVYRPYTSMTAIYLKLTVIDHLLVVSFKEL